MFRGGPSTYEVEIDHVPSMQCQPNFMALSRFAIFRVLAVALIPHIVGGCGNRTHFSVAKGHVSKNIERQSCIRSPNRNLMEPGAGIEPAW